MKNFKHKIKTAVFVLSGASLLMQSCSKDFLELPPESNVTDGQFYKTDDQVLAATATLYNVVWFDYNDKASYNLGDFRGGSAFSGYNDRDNVEFNTTASTLDNGVAWRSFYNAVGQANSTLYNINKYATDEVSQEVRNQAEGECLFMRALAFEHLVMNWGDVPIIENNIDLLENPLSVRRNTIESVWKFITRDYRRAAALLPETEMDEGRLTKWAAEGMLARTYLTRAGVENSGGTRNQTFLDSAKYYSKRVIDLSGASLLDDYNNLFIYPYDNNTESLFSLQWAFASDEWGSNNSAPAYLTPTSELGNGDGWGGDKGASYWMLSLYNGIEEVDEVTLRGRSSDLRLHATFMLPGYVYDELDYMDENGDIQSGYMVPDAGGTLGQDQEFAYVKKYVVGRLAATEATSQHYSHDTYMLRLAEMYLTYAEAELGNSASTSDALAMEYVNEVQKRSNAITDISALTFQDLFEERVKEFAMESRTWYDLVRLHYYNPDLAYQIIGDQDRGLYSIEPDNPDNAQNWTIQKIEWDENRYFTANAGNFQLPLPATEVSSAPNLLQEPVDYEF